jgi:hypothetical protein
VGEVRWREAVVRRRCATVRAASGNFPGPLPGWPTACPRPSSSGAHPLRGFSDVMIPGP